MKLINDKKGTELTLQTIIIFIILAIVLVVMLVFFAKHYGANSEMLIDIGKDTIDTYK